MIETNKTNKAKYLGLYVSNKTQNILKTTLFANTNLSRGCKMILIGYISTIPKQVDMLIEKIGKDELRDLVNQINQHANNIANNVGEGLMQPGGFATKLGEKKGHSLTQMEGFLIEVLAMGNTKNMESYIATLSQIGQAIL